MERIMNRTLVIAASIGLALATTGCAEMAKWQASGSDGGTYMGGTAAVDVDPAGSATQGTGSVSRSGADQRADFAAGVGID